MDKIKLAFNVTFIQGNKGFMVLLIIFSMLLIDLIFHFPENYPGKIFYFGWELPMLVIALGSLIGFLINLYYAFKYSKQFKKERRM